MAQAGMRAFAAAAGLAVLASLTAVLPVAAQASSRNAPALPPLRVVPGSLLLPPPTAVRRVLPDTCGASALAGLVGRLRTQIPVAVDLSRRRVACTACPVAPDVRLDRVNILYDAQTGRVAKITCG